MQHDPNAPRIERYVYRTVANAGKVISTAYRLYHYLLHGFSAQGIILDSPERNNRSVLRVTYKGAQYEAIIRVCNGEIQVFRNADQIDWPDKFPLRKRSKGVEQVKKILDRVLANGVCPKWKAENELKQATEAARLIEEKRIQTLVARVKGKVTRVARDTLLKDRLRLQDVTPDGKIGSFTLKGPWTADDVNKILRFIGDEGL